MTMTPAEKAADVIAGLFVVCSFREQDEVVGRIKDIIQAAIDESLPKWEEIESAPTGKYVLISCLNEACGKRRALKARYVLKHTEEMDCDGELEGDVVDGIEYLPEGWWVDGVDEFFPPDDEPTHWMPLPQPPEDAR